MKEFIVCSAIWIKDGSEHKQQPTNIKTGYVLCGRRHHNCYQSIPSITGESANDYFKRTNSLTKENSRDHQGFITSKDRYVNRKEAWVIAKENNQIKYGLIASDRGEDSILISENLY